MSLLQIYWRALGYLASDKKRVALICGANVALAAIAIVESILFGRVIDAISSHGPVFSMLALWAGLGVFSVVAFVLVARGADRFAHARRSEVLCQSFERVITMPLAWHHQRGTSNALHTLLRAVETLFSLWLEFMRQHLSTAVTLVLLVPTALSMDVRMSMVLLALGVLYVGIGRLVMKRTKAGQAAVERHYHKVFAHVTDSVSNVAVLQSYNRLGHEAETLRRYVRNLLDAQNPVLDWWAIANALQRLSSTISMMVVLIIGAYLVTHGQLRVGDVVAFTGFATLLISRLDQLSAFANQISEARAKLEEFYKLEDSAADAAEPDGLRDLTNVTGHVRFEDVGFEFANSGQGVSDVSFEVQAGQTVAIVGPTGAGKTTLINLLQRVFSPSSGRILIDGIDTRTVTRKSLRHSIATVFQDAGLSQPLDRGQHPCRPCRAPAMTRSMPLPTRPPRRTSSWPRAMATTRWSANVAASCRAASASASPSRVPCSRTPRSWCSTRRPARSTSRPRTASRKRSTSCGATAPPSSSPTA